MLISIGCVLLVLSAYVGYKFGVFVADVLIKYIK